MQGLGVKVTLIVRSRLLRFLDQDMLDTLLVEMRHSGLTVLTDAPHERVEKLADGRHRVVLSNGETVEAERVL